MYLSFYTKDEQNSIRVKHILKKPKKSLLKNEWKYISQNKYVRTYLPNELTHHNKSWLQSTIQKK